ncbi:helix-turn-helix domain-containing protein [Niabella ginsengisoli]|uniref:helix-turn-helix domain-containing protein n=1 Tax=Niabella ginsengisoli TaxID=522298 RepID=UPI00374D0018
MAYFYCLRNLSVKEVSQTAGYSSPSYFGRNFQKHPSTTPNEYRQRVKNNNSQM